MFDPDITVTADDGAFRHDLIRDGKAVSRLWVHDLTMRIGVATVRMGGIGGVVATNHDCRNQGLSAPSAFWRTARRG